jgi:hypothetical protein
VDDKNKPVTGDWREAARKSEQSWNKEPAKTGDAPKQSIEEAMERTEESYGLGKNGTDPGTDEEGTTPSRAAG